MRRPQALLLALWVLASLGGGCRDSQRTQYQDGVRDWHATVERNAWSCEVLGDRLERWLQANAKSFGRATKLLADQALRYSDPDDRAQFLSDLHIEPPHGVREALVKCASDPKVKAASEVWLSLVSPLLLMEPSTSSPIPALPDIVEPPKKTQ